MTTNQIAFYKAKQEAKHNRRVRKETKRHNEALESIQSESNAIQAWINRAQAEHLVRSDAINMAHYERQDSEQRRHNYATESTANISNNIAYLGALAKQEEAEARTTTAEAAMITAGAKEREVGINAWWSLDPYGEKSAQAKYTNVQAVYVPKYYTTTEALNSSTVFKNYVGSIGGIVHSITPLAVGLGG